MARPIKSLKDLQERPLRERRDLIRGRILIVVPRSMGVTVIVGPSSVLVPTESWRHQRSCDGSRSTSGIGFFTKE
jgi:hypothetical protein